MFTRVAGGAGAYVYRSRVDVPFARGCRVYRSGFRDSMHLLSVIAMLEPLPHTG